MWTDLCVVGVGVAFHPSQIGRNTPTPTSASLAGLRAGLPGSGRKRERARWPTPSNAAARPRLAEEQARERAACERRAEVDSGGRQVLPAPSPSPQWPRHLPSSPRTPLSPVLFLDHGKPTGPRAFAHAPSACSVLAPDLHGLAPHLTQGKLPPTAGAWGLPSPR